MKLTNRTVPAKKGINPQIFPFMWTASNYTCSILLMSSSGDRSSPLSFLALVWFTQAFSSSVSLSFISDSYGTEKKNIIRTQLKLDSFKAPLLLLHRCSVYCVCLYPSVSHLVKRRQAGGRCVIVLFSH